MYQALYRKYRPQTFDDVVGQKSVTQTLKAQLQSGHLSHAYLFTGTRGTGKTSCAKILAKAVNCENPVNGNPCNCCPACRSITAGTCLDVQEIDAASNSGVDNVRALRDDAIYTPAEVKKRVYIIDEVHMLSISAFNALLKTIEEPPEHLLFILATTELQKVPATILSRCQRYSFRRLLVSDISERIRYVAQKEQIAIEPQAADLLARLADGALRDAMSLLDQCASSVDGMITTGRVLSCLGLAGSQTMEQLVRALAAHDTAGALKLFFDEYAAGKDLTQMLDELLSWTRDLLMLQVTAGKTPLLSVDDPDSMTELSRLFTPQELIRMVGVLQQTAFNLPKSANQRIDAELCLIQLCTPSLGTDVTGMNARLSRLEAAILSGAVQIAPPAQNTAPPESGKADAAKPEKTQPAAPAAVSPANAKTEPKKPEPKKAEPADWPALAAKLHETLRPPNNNLFGDSRVQGRFRENRLILEAGDTFVKGMLEKMLDTLTQQIQKILQREILLKVVLKRPEPEKKPGDLDDLIQFGRQHSDVITIHQSE